MAALAKVDGWAVRVEIGTGLSVIEKSRSEPGTEVRPPPDESKEAEKIVRPAHRPVISEPELQSTFGRERINPLFRFD